ncbi:FRG1-like family-domain-containing protein [Phellopilus nigrolimitatus]|nr:FRG1-like family-domain-containing protein [Phellopilus nigrolimitatus]
MPTKLKFKGDKSKKKRKHADDEDGSGEGSSRRRRKRDGSADEDDETWVRPDNPLEIRGPTFIFHPSDPSPVCVAFDATRGRIVLTQLDKDKEKVKEEEEGAAADEEEKGEAGVGLLDRTPTDVAQVWVVTRVAGSPTINLRSGVASAAGSGESKFLSCDAHGLVSAFREARGPQEEWTPVIFPDGMVAFQNVYEKYMGVDEVAGGALALRGDAEEVGFNERFYIKVQSKYKREAGEEERKKKEGEAKKKIDEAGTNHIYQAWGAGRSITSNADKVELKKARKEGHLSEALLDRRAKLKRRAFLSAQCRAQRG